METKRRPFYRNIYFIIAITVILLLAIIWIVLSLLYPTASPINVISDIIYSKQHPHQQMSSETVAFLPYWRLDDTKYTRFDLLSEINYFSLSFDKNGNFITVVNNQTDPGWRWWNSQYIKDFIPKTQITGGKFTFTVALSKNKDIEAFLQNPKAQQNLIQNITTQLRTRKLNGVLVDIEYDGKPDDKYRNAFTSFSAKLTNSLHSSVPNASISLAVFPLAVREKKLIDVPQVQSMYDRLIVMSYDYYGAASEVAGPVAPMNGYKNHRFIFDVTTTYSDFLHVVPKNKIIMGIPYYGWDWAVKDGSQIQSETLPQDDPNNYVAVISYGRMKTDTDLKPNQCTWDTDAQENWCWYKDDKNVDHQVWYEENKSLGIKYNFAKTNNLKGVAIWTLGYDKQYPDLWNIMETTFKSQ